MKQLRGAVLLGLLTAITSGCPQELAVWIEPGSTVQRLTFGVAQSRGGPPVADLKAFEVNRCASRGVDETTVWLIEAASEAPKPTRITYGTVPAGFTLRTGPQPIVPGCYRVHVSGSGALRFAVDADGRLHESN
jgi:hypothetical protein